MRRSRNDILKSLIRGVLTAAAVTLIAMLILAAALLFLRFKDSTLRLLNQGIKLISVILGVIAAVPRGSRRGLATGVLVALAYAVIGYILYVALGGAGFSFTQFLGELLLAAAAGAVTGCVRANLRPRGRTTPRTIHG